MATRSIARMFDSRAEAEAAVRDLEQAGFAHDDVSYMGSDNRAANDSVTGASTSSVRTDADRDADDASGTGAATGATLGTVIGGGAGLLAGLGALAIPGVGPVVAAGWLVATLTGAGVGAAAGSLVGALAGAGLGGEEAHTYAEGLRRGGHLVVVRADDSRIAEAERIMQRHNPVDMAQRTDSWRASGWTAADGTTGDSVTGAGANEATRLGRGNVA